MSRTVLIVDDEQEVIDVIVRRLLLDDKYEPMVATDGYEALDLMRNKPIALVILDIHMRNLDGLAVCREVAADKRLKTIPILISSAFVNEENEATLRSLGIKHFLKKPYPMEELGRKIDDILH